MAPTTPLRTVAPHEARDLPPISPDPTLDQAIRDVATAVNGFPYPGSSDAIVAAIRWLRHNPDHVAVLFPQDIPAESEPAREAVDAAVGEVPTGALGSPRS